MKGGIKKNKMIREIEEFIQENSKTTQSVSISSLEIKRIIEKLLECYSFGGKVLIAGNGGSAADAQHFAAELVGRYKLERKALSAIALTANTSNLTAIGNDYEFENIFKRQVEALGQEKDVLFSISTSGNSQNLILAIEEAKKKGMFTISLLGKGGGRMSEISDISIIISSQNTPRIQEAHILIIHIICELLEKNLFQK